MSTIRRTALWASVCAMATLMSGCADPFGFLYTFDRELAVGRGAIFGKAVRDAEGGEVAPYAQVALVGTGFSRSAASDGVVVVTDLGAGTYVMRIQDDEDGDGQPERSRLLATTLVVAKKPDALGFGTAEQLVSVSIGEVVLEGTGVVRGEVRVDDGTGTLVPPVDAGLVGRVLLYRSFDASTDGSGPAFELGADAETHVDDTGAYRFNKALAGDVNLVVTLHTLESGQRGPTVYVSAPQALAVPNAGTVDGGILNISATNPTLEDDVRPVEVAVTPALEERGTPYAIFVPPGRAVSTCQQVRPAITQFPYERIVSATTGVLPRLNNAPLGVWDVRLCGEARFIDAETGAVQDDIEVAAATLYNVIVSPSEDGISTILVGPVVLSPELDLCVRRVCEDGTLTCSDDARVLIRDCDGDNLEGLPLYDVTDDDVRALYSACSGQCGLTVGADAAASTCTTGGKTYDCDDDGDLQADTTEPPECYGPGLGDDRDGDGVCTGVDPFPSCRANTAADCAAGTVDVSPQVPEEFGGTPTTQDGGVPLIDAGGTNPRDGGTTILPDGGTTILPDGGGDEIFPFDRSFGNGDGISDVTTDASVYDVIASIAYAENKVLTVTRRTTETAAVLFEVTNFDTAGAPSVAPFPTPNNGSEYDFLVADVVNDAFNDASYFAGIESVSGFPANTVICRVINSDGTLLLDPAFGNDSDGCARFPPEALSGEVFVPGAVTFSPTFNSVYFSAISGTGTGIPSARGVYFGKVFFDDTNLLYVSAIFGPGDFSTLTTLNPAVSATTVGLTVHDVVAFGTPRVVATTAGNVATDTNTFAFFASVEIEPGSPPIASAVTVDQLHPGDATLPWTPTGVVGNGVGPFGSVVVVGEAGTTPPGGFELFEVVREVATSETGPAPAPVVTSFALPESLATATGGVVTIDASNYIVGASNAGGGGLSPEVWRIDGPVLTPLLNQPAVTLFETNDAVATSLSRDPFGNSFLFGTLNPTNPQNPLTVPLFGAKLDTSVIPAGN